VEMASSAMNESREGERGGITEFVTEGVQSAEGENVIRLTRWVRCGTRRLGSR
jgi:hypothetical protein